MKPAPGFDSLRREHDALTAWLVQRALPLWWEVGADHKQGGFFEQIGQDGRIIDGPRRVRVSARQIYSFAKGREFGWNGPVEAVDHGLNYLLGKGRTPDGCFRSVVAPDGSSLGRDFDLYDNAFGLFGLAAACRAGIRAQEVTSIAKEVLGLLRGEYGNPRGGFEESNPRTLPLKANPHMHLLEAALAWLELVPADRDWNALADEIVELCFAKFIDPANGCVREYFDDAWNLAVGDAGRIAEPGHQFEWAWLLSRWSKLRNRADALAAARTLVSIGERFGVDPSRGVAFNEIWTDLTPKDAMARLWPQTERVRGWLKMAAFGHGSAALDAAFGKAADAASALRKYLETPIPGLWRDRMGAGGKFVEEPAPASSLYHIVGAITEMHAAVAETA
jgi:mannose/cellobiose epimerase-like protein (N-acyl-D-glucosamine 2-epimerase family)